MDEVSEGELLECAAAGRVLEGHADGTCRIVAAGLLRRLCLLRKDEVDPRGIQLRNVVVSGQLDLAGLDVPFSLRFDACEFEAPLVVEGAQLNHLAVTDSALPGLLANGVRIHRDLDLSRSQVTGAHESTASDSRLAAIWLCESEIGGRLLCSDTVIRAPGERALQADHMRTGGAVRFLRQFTAYGEIRLLGMQSGGSLDLTGAHIYVLEGIALDLTDAVIKGSVFLITAADGRRPVVQGRIYMSSAQVSGQLRLRGATLAAPASEPVKSGYSRFRAVGTAIRAPRLTVDGQVSLEGDSVVTGGIDMAMSTLSSLLIDSGCSLKAPGKIALDLANAEILSAVVISEEVPVEGTLRFAGASIHGDLRLRKARLSAPADRILIDAQGARIDGEVRLEELQARGGELSFRATTIQGAVEADGAHLLHPDGCTLNLVQANVKGSVRLTRDFVSTGKVDLNGAQIQGSLLCSGSTFSCPGPSEHNSRGHCIEAISASVSGGMDLAWRSASPSADFTNTTTSSLADDPARWPERFSISGFSYERLEHPQGLAGIRTWDHKARSAWLGQQTAYDAGPYEQAARVFRQHGYNDGAKAILIAQRRHARSTITGRGARPRRVLDIAYSLTVGYGYRPIRVLWLIVVLLIFVTVTLQVPAARETMRATTPAGAVYTTTGPLPAQRASPPANACGNGEVRCFNPVFYAIDTVVPLISLDQRGTWYPDPGTSTGALMQWWLNVAAILGWLLSSIFVLSLASLARSV